jgi:hypothetical protein
MNGLDAVRATLGSAEQSGFTDDYIKETLYHYYFDVEQTINYILGEQFVRFLRVQYSMCRVEQQVKRRTAEERKGELIVRDFSWLLFPPYIPFISSRIISWSASNSKGARRCFSSAARTCCTGHSHHS